MSKWEMKLALAIFFAATVLASAFAGYEYFLITSYQTKETAPLSGKILWHGNREIPEIALTFDDGPSSKYTPQVLDILDKNGVKATFFVLGKFLEKNNDVLKREARDGHVIGNHTFNHPEGTVTDIAEIDRELVMTDDLISKYTGRTAKYFRPPFGFQNWRFMTEAELLDYTIVLWSIDVGDWNNHKTVSDITGKIFRNVRNGSIILLHDGGASREAVIESLPVIITTLKKKGYKFVTIDEMLAHI